MANINEILARAAALRDETALNSISPERAGGIMYDTLLALNELWLQQGSALVISKIYASVAAMEADSAPVSDLTGQPLRPGMIVVIASSDSDNGSVYRYNGIVNNASSWTLVGAIGNLDPVDSLDSDSTTLPLAAHQGKVLDGKINQLGQDLYGMQKTVNVSSTQSQVINIFPNYSGPQGTKLKFRVVSEGAGWTRIALFSGDWGDPAFKKDNIVNNTWYEVTLSEDATGILLYLISGITVGAIHVEIYDSRTTAYKMMSIPTFPLSSENIGASSVTKEKLADSLQEIVNSAGSGKIGYSIEYTVTQAGTTIPVTKWNYPIPVGSIIKRLDSVNCLVRLISGNTTLVDMHDGDVFKTPMQITQICVYNFGSGVTSANIKLAVLPQPVSSIVDGSVKEDSTIFFDKGVNLVDESDYVTYLSNIDNVYGYYINGNSYGKNDNYWITKPIPVTPGQQFVAAIYQNNGALASGNVRWINYYDANLNYLSTVTVTSGERVFTAPSGDVAFMRISQNIPTYATTGLHLKVAYGTDLSWSPYKRTLKTKYLPNPEEAKLPDLVLTTDFYALIDTENSVYFRNIFEYLKSEHVVKSIGWTSYQRYARKSTGNSGDLTVKLFDLETLTEKKSKTTTVHYGSLSTDNGLKVINTIGDSFTYNGTWFNQINTLCPNLSFVGMRKSYNTDESLRAEGRGGWTLAAYMTTLHNSSNEFSPFIHPQGYKYYGVVGFWKDIVNDTIGDKSYYLNGYDDYKTWFGTDGYKLNPQQNDLMYDNTAGAYKYWNGSAWVMASVTDSDFVFDYAKYIEVWNITSPDFVMIMLGVNDWFGAYSDSAAETWNDRMSAVITSIQAYATANNKTITIGICTNTTIASLPNSSYGDNPAFSSRSMFKGRKNTIENFDSSAYQGQGVYVVDTGACLDSDYGFNMQQIKPFTYFEGTEREIYDNNGVHPSTAGYKQLGTCASAFIQYIRGLNP